MVPNGWKQNTLSQIVKERISYGIVQAGPDIDDGVPYIKSSDIRGGINLNQLQRTSHDIHNKYHRSAVHPGDIVFSLRGNIGEVAIIPNELKEANLTQGTARISVSNEHDNLFQYYQINSASVLNNINALSKGSTFKEISLEELRKVKLLCPPLSEQKKIAQILSTWDQAITTTERLLDLARQQKKALMQQLLTGKKRLLDKNKVRFSDEWTFIGFDKIFHVNNKKSAQIKSSDYLETGSVPIVDQGKQLIAGYCNNKERYTSIPVIIFGDHTRCLKWVDFEFCPGADGTQVLDTNGYINKKFGYYLLCFTDIPNLGYSRHMRELKEKEFKIPINLEEQQKIAEILSRADQEITSLQSQLDALKQEKKALMQQLLTGKRRVKI